MKYRVYFYVDHGGEDGPVSVYRELSTLQEAIEFSEDLPKLYTPYRPEFDEIIKFEKVDYTPESLKKLLEEEREQDKINKLKRDSQEEQYSKPIDGFF